jgi:ubiquinone/menaquinone biosynthesis C-methylase UbiE
MSFFDFPRRFDEKIPEMVDLPDANPDLLEGELRNLRIINRRLGGLSAVRSALLLLALKADPSRTLHILDLATGSGDQPVALAHALTRLRRRAVFTAIDRNERMLETARRISGNSAKIRFEKGDILSPAYPDRSFDIVLCSLAIHHFSWNDATRILRQMDRLCRIGFVLCDLSRSRLAVLGAWAYTHLTTTNIMTRKDAVASVLAAFTKEELAALATDAGVGPLQIYTAPAFRLIALKEKHYAG